MKLFGRSLFLLLCLALAAVIVGCGGSGKAPGVESSSSNSGTGATPAQSGNSNQLASVIKIGHIGPLSGPNAFTGESILKGVQLAVKEANVEGGLPDGATIELLVGDDRGTPTEAVALAQKFISDDKVVAIVGPFTSATVQAVKEVVTRAQIPMASTGAGADNLTEGDVDWYFRPHMYNKLQSTQFARYIVETLGMKKLGIIYENNDWGKGLDTLMTRYFQENGAEVVAHEGFNSGSTDFSAALTKIKNANPDGIVAIALITEAAIIARQAHELGIPGDKIVGLGGWDQDKLWELAGPAANGIKFMMWYAPEHPEIPAAKDFAEAYQKEYGQVPDSFAAQGYTAAKTVILAIRKAGSADPKAIRDAMEQSDWESPIGRVTFGPDHNAKLSVFMAQWQDGKKVLLEKQPRIE